MILSKSSIYGLRASILLAKKNRMGFTTIRELSEELNISFHFLTKVLQELTKSEIMVSFKGPNGGVKLAKPPNKITFKEIVNSIDGNYIIHDCPLGLSECGELDPCPLHDQWMDLKWNLEVMMAKTTLDDILARSQHYKTVFAKNHLS
ncbi:MAG: Rrf2 family transcriptional regulator [Balneolaceae bacterium]